MPPWSEVPLARGSHRFRTTRWSLIATAGRVDDSGRRALAELCEQYWPPLYGFARRQGHDPATAADHTQGFFLHLLGQAAIAKADATRGRFRTFLLQSFKNYLHNEHDRASAQKRGGDVTDVSFDVETAEAEFLAEPVDAVTPEAAFDRRWALALLDRVLDRMRQEYAARQRADVFAVLEPYLQDPDPDGTYAEKAAVLGMSEGSVKVTVHRLRRRFQELLVEEVAETLAEGDSARDEVAVLLTALGGAGQNPAEGL